MTDTQKATTRPWHIGKTYGRINRRVPIYPDTPTLEQLVICEAGGKDAEANAALIVQAANSFDAMREALRACDEYVQRIESDGELMKWYLGDATRKVRAALKAAAESKVE